MSTLENGVPYHEHHDDDVRAALAEALGERKVRLTDRRLLLCYLLLIVALVWIGLVVRQSNEDRHHFEQMIAKSCQDTRKNARVINLFLDKQITAYATSPVLSRSERKARAAMFTGLKQKVPTCPPGR